MIWLAISQKHKIRQVIWNYCFWVLRPQTVQTCASKEKGINHHKDRFLSRQNGRQRFKKGAFPLSWGVEMTFCGAQGVQLLWDTVKGKRRLSSSPHGVPFKSPAEPQSVNVERKTTSLGREKSVKVTITKDLVGEQFLELTKGWKKFNSQQTEWRNLTEYEELLVETRRLIVSSSA